MGDLSGKYMCIIDVSFPFGVVTRGELYDIKLSKVQLFDNYIYYIDGFDDTIYNYITGLQIRDYFKSILDIRNDKIKRLLK